MAPCSLWSTGADYVKYMPPLLPAFSESNLLGLCFGRKRAELEEMLITEEVAQRVKEQIEERVRAAMGSDAVQQSLQARLEEERKVLEEQVCCLATHMHSWSSTTGPSHCRQGQSPKLLQMTSLCGRTSHRLRLLMIGYGLGACGAGAERTGGGGEGSGGRGSQGPGRH